MLRNAIRRRDSGDMPAPPAPPPGAPPGERAEALAIATSHPTWMVARWLGRYGEAGALALLAANNRRAPGVLPAVITAFPHTAA